MSPELTALVTAITVVLLEVGRLVRETHLRRAGVKRTRDTDDK